MCGGSAIRALGVDIGTVVDEKRYDGFVTPFDGFMQGRFTIVVGDIEASAFLNQDFGDIEMALFSNPM